MGLTPGAEQGLIVGGSLVAIAAGYGIGCFGAWLVLGVLRRVGRGRVVVRGRGRHR